MLKSGLLFSGFISAFGGALLLAPSAAQAAPDEDGVDLEAEQATDENQRVRVSSDDDDYDDDDDDRGTFRLNIEMDTLGFTHFNANDDDIDGGTANAVGFGIGRMREIDTFSRVPGRPVIGLGFGYMFPDDRAILGARLGFTVDGVDLGDADARAVAVAGEFIPYFQWVFLPDRDIRPYVEVRAGLLGGTAATEVDLGPTIGTVRETRTALAPVVGAGTGAHFWVIDELSIDVGLNVDYWAPFARVNYEDDAAPTDEDFNLVGHTFNVALMTGLSAWF